ncbi:anti-sigma factor family protein [Streptomyces sp. NPDC059582]|uniref:anti-sigma factor family protein n=1 Tax=Streptomyces sp. NPDC059582 TaxID=3346875 RepID=UPI00369526B4
MTSTTDMAGHPDVAEISDLTEGLLPPSRGAEVRRHLDGCELCSDVQASLEEIRGLLGTLPGPPRMPAEVASRIDAALAAEALLDATTPDAVGAPLSAPVIRSTAGVDDSTDVSRETSATPARPAGHARNTSTGPGRKSGRRRGRRKVTILGAAFAAAALGLGSVLLSSLWNDSQPGNSAVDTFSEGTLERQVATLLTQNSGGTRSPRGLGVESAPTTDKPKVFSGPTVPSCIQAGIGRDDAALATEEGVYKGTEALLVVLSNPSDTNRVTVYIVDATCVSHPSSATAKVLLTHSYARS